MKKSLQQISQE